MEWVAKIVQSSTILDLQKSTFYNFIFSYDNVKCIEIYARCMHFSVAADRQLNGNYTAKKAFTWSENGIEYFRENLPDPSICCNHSGGLISQINYIC